MFGLKDLFLSMDPTWKNVLKSEISQPYFLKLDQFLGDEVHHKKIVYPARENIFRAFTLTPFHQVRVVILGQDPYHGEDQADGLAFSMSHNQAKFPPSLRNIFKEVADNFKMPHPRQMSGLDDWSRQGVFLLNTVLTVEAGKAFSHRQKGWEQFTHAALRALSRERQGLIFMLWGKPAQDFAQDVDRSRHVLLETCHPSPLSAYRGFLGCGHFRRVNEILQSRQTPAIRWMENAQP